MNDQAIHIRDQIHLLRKLAQESQYTSTDKALVAAIVAVSLEADIQTNLRVKELLDYSESSLELNARET